MTAVEWLIDEIEKHYIINNGSLDPTVVMELKNQAKQMEKEQMCKFAYKCHNHYKVNGDFKIEQYYNETYKTNQNDLENTK